MTLNAFERDKNLTLKDFWKSYNIYNAVQNIAFAWDEVKQTSLNGVWKKTVSPVCVISMTLKSQWRL